MHTVQLPFPLLGLSDHNLIHLQPVYVPDVQRLPVTTRTFRDWTPEAEEALRDCFETTDWSVLQDSDDLEEATSCTTDYINFCMDSVVPTKTVRCYPNNKPWITSSVKQLLNRKKKLFKEGNMMELRSVQRDLKRNLREAKAAYGRKVEMKMMNNTKEAWQGIKNITGCGKKRGMAEGDLSMANDLNHFFNRFGNSVMGAANSLATSIAPLPPLDINCSASSHPSVSLPLTPSTITSCSMDTTSPHSSAFTLASTPVIHHTTSAPPLMDTSDSATPAASILHPTHTASHLSSAHPPPTITTDQVRGALKHLKSKAAGPDGISARLLKSCAEALAEPLHHLFNRSLQEGKVPTLWKTSCLIPIPKKAHPKELNDYRPVALTSHLMKTFERVLLRYHLKPQVHHALDPLQFAYKDNVGVEDAILYLLHRVHSHLDKGGCAVRIMFFDFSSAFNTIHPLLLRDKLVRMGVESGLVTWITDYLTERPQFVRLGSLTSEMVVSSIGAPQGTVLSPVLFTLYTNDFNYNSGTCHMQKFSDDTAIVACIKEGQEEEYRGLVEDFVGWCRTNQLHLNTSKTREMVVDFRRSSPPLVPASIEGENVETVSTYKYLGVHLDNKLDWSANSDALYKKGQSRLYFLRRLRSFNVCNRLLVIFYQSVMASVLFYAVACWGGSIRRRDAGRLDRLVRKAGAVVGTELETLTSIAESRTLNRLDSVMDNQQHPLHTTFTNQMSLFSHRLRALSCRTDRLQRSFVPWAIQLFNSLQRDTKKDIIIGDWTA